MQTLNSTCRYEEVCSAYNGRGETSLVNRALRLGVAESSPPERGHGESIIRSDQIQQIHGPHSFDQDRCGYIEARRAATNGKVHFSLLPSIKVV